MRIFTLITLLFVASPALAEFCNWGFAGPKRFRCNGETYYYGTAACKSGVYSNVFCHQRHNQDGQACQGDEDPQTIRCYEEMTAVGTPAKKEFCNWGFAGPEVFACKGEHYYYGSAACDSGIYANIFCHKSKSQNGAECQADNSAKTIACYEELAKHSRFRKSNPKKATGSTETQSGWPNGKKSGWPNNGEGVQ